MLGILKLIAGPLLKIGQEWATNRSAIKQATVEAKIARSQALASGWLPTIIGIVAMAPFGYIFLEPLMAMFGTEAFYALYQSSVDAMIQKFKWMFDGEGYYHYVVGGIMASVFGLEAYNGQQGRKHQLKLNGMGAAAKVKEAQNNRK